MQSILLLPLVLATSSWKSLAPIAIEPRQENGVGAVGEDVYILGGITTLNTTLEALPSLPIAQAYSTSKDEWRRIADVPLPINHGNVASVDNKLYLLGALTGVLNVTGLGTNWTNDVPINYVYTPETDAWTALPALQDATTWRGASAVGVWRDTVLIAGGLTGQVAADGVPQPTVAFVSAFNTTSETWTTLPDLPEPRDHVGGAVVDDVFYVVGGRLNSSTEVRGTVFALDLLAVNKGWELRPGTMPTPRGGLSTAAVGQRIYTFGGEGAITDERPEGVYDNVEVYDTTTDTWEVLPPMAHPRHGTGAAAVDGKIYIPGGANHTNAGAVDTNDVFIP
ncbi:hypothetical protein PG996_005278 [Apiospora saccharicola]|uniref:Galactose oxidase n=1 Tax=Apiospora saccharicola TaxID=335842 RepID=A0ABR1VNZ1_9PEZI